VSPHLLTKEIHSADYLLSHNILVSDLVIAPDGTCLYSHLQHLKYGRAACTCQKVTLKATPVFLETKNSRTGVKCRFPEQVFGKGLLRAPTSHQDVGQKFRGICFFCNLVTTGKFKTGLVSVIDIFSLPGHLLLLLPLQWLSSKRC